MNVLKQFIEEGRLIRKEWFGTDSQGRQTACLYAALTGSSNPDACPSSVMPVWMAHLTPWIDDAGSDEHWPSVVRRYADLQERWHVLTPEDWSWLEFKTKRICLAEAMGHTKDKDVLAICERVLALLDRALSGDVPTPEEFRMAARWAAAAADAAAKAASDRMIDAILDAIEARVILREVDEE
jgi:hypothetical protein